MEPNIPQGVEKATRNYTKERDDACIPVARQILKILAAKDDLLMGSSHTASEEKALEYYSDLYEAEIAPLLIAKNLKVDHVKYAFSLVKQAIQFIADRTELTIEAHYNNATAFKWGVKDTDEIDLAMIQETLTKGLPAEAVDNQLSDEKKE